MTTGECRHTDQRPLWGCRTGRWKVCRGCGVTLHLPFGHVYEAKTYRLITEPRAL